MATRRELEQLLKDKDFRMTLLTIPSSYHISTMECEDVVQNGYLEMWKKEDWQLWLILNLRGFVWGVVKNKSREWLRRPEEDDLPDDKDVELVFPTPLSDEEWKRLEEFILKHRGDSAKSDLMIFKMLREGYCYKEIADAVRDSENNIKQRIRRLKLWIRDNFKR